MNMRKILAAMLVVVMVLAMVPVTAQAAEFNVVDDTIYESGKLYLDKTATLEDDGTYTIEMEAFATGNVEVTHEIIGKPLDVVLVIDQSGSVEKYGYLDGLKTALNTFIKNLQENGAEYGKTHRVAVVGFSCSEWELTITHSTGNNNETNLPLADGSYAQLWTNTGIYQTDGTFTNYQQFEFTPITKSDLPTTASDYYTFYGSYTHPVYGGAAQDREFPLYFTDDTETWSGQTVKRSIYLYNGNWYYDFRTNNGMNSTLTREQVPNMDTRALYRIKYDYNTETGEFNGGYLTDADYQDTLMNVTNGTDGQGDINAALNKIIKGLGASGATRTGTGMEMAYNVLAKNELTEQDIAEGRERVVIVFTDGVPGQGPFEIEEANIAMHYSGLIKSECKDSGDPATGEDAVEIYTIGLFDDKVFEVGTDGDADKIAQAKVNADILMNGLSSNWPEADSMDDISGTSITTTEYVPQTGAISLNAYRNNRDSWVTFADHYVKIGDEYVPIEVQYTYDGLFVARNHNFNFRYKDPSTGAYVTLNRSVSNAGNSNASVTFQNPTVYKYTETTIVDRTNGGEYYKQAANIEDLKDMFPVLEKTNESTSMESSFLTEGSILRDIMGAGFLLSGKTTITSHTQEGQWTSSSEDHTTGTITWSNEVVDVAKKEITDPKKLSMPSITDPIQVYNTNPGENNDNVGGNFYQTADGTLNLSAPPTIDITGFNYSEEYIAPNKTGKKLIVRITGVEAQPGVVTYGESNDTNHAQSGLWAPMDEETHQRTLVEKFPIPNTTFTESLYVLDYAKPMNIPMSDVLKDLKLDVAVENLDADGMHFFDKENPNLVIVKDPANLSFGDVNGKVELKDILNGEDKVDLNSLNSSKIVYTPLTTAWNGYEIFSIFGETTDAGVKAHSANTNGNLWGSVKVLPANNVYYEDSFIQSQNGVTVGIVYDGTWDTVGTESGNQELPESGETNKGDMPFGGVHGWEDYLQDDTGFSDGSAHKAELTDSSMTATATFTFTGTGVDIYSYTDLVQGAVLASIYRGDHVPTTDEMKQDSTKRPLYSCIMDNFSLSESGGYYQIPTLSLHEKNVQKTDADGNKFTAQEPLEHDTYTVKLTVVAKIDDADNNDATVDEGRENGQTRRYTYHLDGIRIYNPIQNLEGDKTVQRAYGEEELNASFVEVRDILLDAASFDGTDNGVVFLDQIPADDPVNGSQNPDDQAGKETDKIGLYECYGPKNEVYLASGQSIAFIPREGLHYYVGLKSPTGEKVCVSIQKDGVAQLLEIDHTTDLYYEVTPVEGIVLIQNAGMDEEFNEFDNLLSVTKIKVTGPDGTEVETADFFEPADQPTVLRMVRTLREEAAAEPEIPEDTEPTEPTGPEVDIENPTEPTGPEVDIENPTEPTEPEVPEEGGNDDNYLWKLIGGIFDLIRGIIIN